MIALAAVIGAAAAFGIAAEHRFERAAERLSERLMWLVLWVLMPVVAFVNIAALHLTARVGAGIGFAYVALAITMVSAFVVGTFVLRLPRPTVGTLMCVSALGNTGYLGLPFVATLLGFGQVPNAVAYDALVSSAALVTIGFSIGAAFGTIAERPRDRLRAFLLRNPPLWATVLGFMAPSTFAPAWAVSVSHVIVVAILPVGFFAVGVTLAAQARASLMPRMSSPIATAVALKLLLPPGILLALSSAVLAVPRAYLAQAAMAAGINNLVVANAYGLDRGLAAAAIAWTSVIVVGAGVVAVLV